MVAVVFLVAVHCAAAVGGGRPTGYVKYRDAALPIPTRVKDLLGRMTVEEKVAQLLHPWESLDPAGVYRQFNKTGLGSCTFSTRTNHSDCIRTAL